MAKNPLTHIRPFIPEDIPDAVILAKKAAPYAWSESVFRDCLKANYHGWVVTSDESVNKAQLRGFMIVLDQLDECQLLNLVVDPDFQRQGIGYQLLDHLVKYARKHGMQRVSLEVRSSNQAAISLYRMMGFIEVGIRKHYYPCDTGREDAYLFLLQIT